MARPLHRSGALLGGLACAQLFLAAWLFLPRERGAMGGLAAPVRVVVVDASASVERRRPSWLAWVREELSRQARGAGSEAEEIAVVVFASDVTKRFGPADPAQLLDLLAGGSGRPFDPREGAGDPGASELARALEVAHGIAGELARAPGSVVLLSDGAGGEARALRALADLAGDGIGLVIREPFPPELPDAALLRLEVAAEVEPGSPLVARAHVVVEPGLDSPRELEVVARVRSGAQEFEFVTRAELGGGREELDLPLALGLAPSGRTLIRAEVRLPGRLDPIPENDRASAVTRASGEVLVLVLAPEEELSRCEEVFAPAGVTRRAGLEFVFAGPADCGAVLAEADVVVTCDLPLSALPSRALEAFVRGGHGWLALSGPRFLADWLPSNEERGLRGLLPLAPAPLDGRERTIVLLVDGSGSMEGSAFDELKAAASELAGSALPSDRLVLRFFTSALEAERVLKERGVFGVEAARGSARVLLDARVPRGSTRLVASLGELALELEGRPEEALVLLLSDGKERDFLGDRGAAAAQMASRYASSGLRLVPIAVGADVDEEILSALAPRGETYLVASGSADLRRIFQREIQAARTVEAASLSVLAVQLDAHSLAAEVFPAAPSDELPTLERYVRDVARPGASVAWTSERGDPLLGLSRVSRGRVALFASMPHGEWAPLYGAAGGAPLGAILRWLGRGTDELPPGPRVSRLADALRLEGLDPGAPTRRDALLAPMAAGGNAAGTADGEEPAVRLGFEVPRDVASLDALGAREARLAPALRARAARGGMVLLLDPDWLASEGESWAYVPAAVAPEFDLAYLPADLSDLAGALVHERSGEHHPAAHPLAPWMLASGILALCLAALLGRFRGAGPVVLLDVR